MKEPLKLLTHTSVWTLLRLIDIWHPQEQMLSELPFLHSPTSEEFVVFIIIRKFYYKPDYVEQLLLGTKDHIDCGAYIIFSLLM